MKKFIHIESRKMRGAAAIGLSVLLTVATGCSAPGGRGVPPVSQAASVSPASAPGVSSGLRGGSSAASDGGSVNPDAGGGASSRTRQSVLDRIGAALDTKVPVVLPASLPVGEGRYLTATTVSQPESYQVNFYETDQPVEIDSQAASQGTPIASVEGTEYPDAPSAKKSIADYRQVNASDYDEFLDLGNRLKAVTQAGLGHEHIFWNEGRWYVEVDSAIDPAFQIKGYPDGERLAKDVAAYLDGHMLPTPKEIGTILVKNWNQSSGTAVQWQDGRASYRIGGKDPMTALKVAAVMDLKRGK